VSVVARRGLPWISLGVLVIGLLGWAAWPAGDASGAAARTRELARELRCPDCEGLSVADSSTTSAAAIRDEIRELADRGRTDAEIRQVYVDRYGESILLEPEGRGLGLLVWGLPVVALGAGVAGLVLALRRWRRAPSLRASAADESLVIAARQGASPSGDA
jgi:cytochrome c-type biogenesis protein CcmH